MENKYILITGAAKRLGKDIAIYLAQNNFHLVIHYNTSKNKALELKKELTSLKIKCFLIQANLNNENEIVNIFSTLKQNKIELIGLINNASSFNFDDTLNYNKDFWEENFNTNLKAPFILANEFMKQIPKETKFNNYNIINIIDTQVNKSYSCYLSYNLAKFALYRLTEDLAISYAPLIRVNGVSPGLTLKPDNMKEDNFYNMYKKTLLQKPVSSLAIAKTVLFLLQNEYITGEIINVDCGYKLK